MTSESRKFAGFAVLALLFPVGSTSAQYAPVDPTPLGDTASSVMANKLSGDIAGGSGGSGRSISSRCAADSGPGPERRVMEGEHRRRLAAGGRAGADAWRAEHGRAYRAGLIASGKCPRTTVR